MNCHIPAICEAIRRPGGTDLLYLLRAVYKADYIYADSVPEALVQKAIELGAVTHRGKHLALTDAGYLIGNVAKEYCNWLDNGRRMPPPRPDDASLTGKIVLDLGCSYGRWLWEFQRIARSVVGIEFQPEYPLLGAALAEVEGIHAPAIHIGSAEDVDKYIAPESIDVVFTRLMFNHVHIRSTMAKIAGVIKPGGLIWVQVEPFNKLWCQFLKRKPGREVRHKIFNGFALLNSLIYSCTGRQMQISVRGRMHARHKPAYPTRAAWRRTLQSVGFSEVTFDVGANDLVFWARKRDG